MCLKIVQQWEIQRELSTTRPVQNDGQYNYYEHHISSIIYQWGIFIDKRIG